MDGKIILLWTGTQGDGAWWYMGVFSQKRPLQCCPHTGETAEVL